MQDSPTSGEILRFAQNDKGELRDSSLSVSPQDKPFGFASGQALRFRLRVRMTEKIKN
jgi:hypothetical protein